METDLFCIGSLEKGSQFKLSEEHSKINSNKLYEIVGRKKGTTMTIYKAVNGNVKFLMNNEALVNLVS
jgi:hypothetical protein